MNKRTMKIWRIRAIVTGCALAVILVPLCFFAGPDQIRHVPAPAHPFAPYFQEDPRTTLKTDNSSQIESSIDAESEAKKKPVANSENKYQLLIIPDTSLWPEKHQKVARQWKREMDETINALIALSDPASGMTLEAARSEHERLSDDFLRNINMKYNRVIPNSRMKVLVDTTYRLYKKIHNGSLLAIFVEHEDWSGAASITSFNDWDTAVYYYRKMGWKGRLLLVRQSIFRQYARRVFDSSVEDLVLEDLKDLPGFQKFE